MNVTQYHTPDPVVLPRNYQRTSVELAAYLRSPNIVTYHRPSSHHKPLNYPTNINSSLSPKAAEILRSAYACRLMTAKQIERLYFYGNNSSTTGTRICRRVLKRMAEQDILRRRQRRIGGIRAGSASYIYSIGAEGARLVSDKRVHYYIQDPSDYFMEHTLALTELYVSLYEQSRNGKFEILEIQTEPSCWRTFTTLVSGKLSLRSDMFVRLGVGTEELSYFIEMDRGTSHSPSLLNKLRTYESYYLSGKEQMLTGVFPQVLWVVLNNKRKTMLEAICNELNQRIPNICKVVALGDEIEAMTGAEPP